MNPWEIVLIVACVLFVAGVAAWSIVKKIRNKKKGVVACCDCGGSCSGGCGSCGNCHGCMSKEELKKFLEK